MKKIILILFLFLSCYLIYNLTEKESISILVMGDNKLNKNIIKQNNNITYNSNYTDAYYRITDLINIIKYNEEKEINNEKISLHRLLKTSDILIISIGMNDIYSKLNTDTFEIYTYINDMVNNMEILLEEINKYSYKQVLILGYYNITNKNNDLFTYLNYKMKKITTKYNYEYIELNNIIKNNLNYLKNDHNFELNNQGLEQLSKIIVEKLKIY